MRVIKLGGSLLDDAPRRTEVLRGISKAWKNGEQLILVHGGFIVLTIIAFGVWMLRRRRIGRASSDQARTGLRPGAGPT